VKVLIVEDELEIGTVLTEFLEEEGFEVQTVPNGQAALTMLGQEQGYVVLLDVMMPILDGYGVIESLRKDHRLDYHQIILMSAADRQARARALLQAGMIAAYIAKPFEIERLLALVKQSAAKLARVKG